MKKQRLDEVKVVGRRWLEKNIDDGWYDWMDDKFGKPGFDWDP